MSFVSIDLWTIIMQWGNLFILLLLCRRRPTSRLFCEKFTYISFVP